MRGGSIPLLTMATTLTVALAVNWIWTGDTIQVGTFAFSVITLIACATALAVRSRGESIRRGPPGQVGPEAVPTSSLGAVGVAVAVAAVVFGFAFGRFLVYFGGGLLAASLARLTLELRAQRDASAREHRERTGYDR